MYCTVCVQSNLIFQKKGEILRVTKDTSSSCSPPFSHTSFKSLGETYSWGSSWIISCAPCSQREKKLLTYQAPHRGCPTKRVTTELATARANVCKFHRWLNYILTVFYKQHCSNTEAFHGVAMSWPVRNNVLDHNPEALRKWSTNTPLQQHSVKSNTTKISALYYSIANRLSSRTAGGSVAKLNKWFLWQVEH